MNYLDNNKIKNDVIDLLIGELHNYEGCGFYGADLGYGLLEGYNIDGVIFYNNYKAEEYIKTHFEDLGEIIEEIKFQFDSEFISKLMLDMFDSPDRFCCVVYLEVASYLCGRCKFVDDNWNNEFELTEDNIKVIVSQLKELKDNE